MQKNKLKRLPVMRGENLVGIVSRANLLRAVASLAREIPDPTADDDHIRDRIINAPAEHMRVIRFVSVKRAGAADRNRAGVTENLPLPLRCLYRERRTSAIYTSWPSTRRPSTRSKASAWKLMFPVICPPPESAGQRALLPVQH